MTQSPQSPQSPQTEDAILEVSRVARQQIATILDSMPPHAQLLTLIELLAAVITTSFPRKIGEAHKLVFTHLPKFIQAYRGL